MQCQGLSMFSVYLQSWGDMCHNACVYSYGVFNTHGQDIVMLVDNILENNFSCLHFSKSSKYLGANNKKHVEKNVFSLNETDIINVYNWD